MILNISGRTDIVAFYTPWLLKRLGEGFVDVRNPFVSTLVHRIYFQDVDLIVFCTKNPLPILPYLSKITIPFVFHITVTPYQKDIEKGVPDKSRVIEAIHQIASLIGKEKVFVRYDPIFINEKYTIEYHLRAFERLCTLLKGATSTIIVSFLDTCKNTIAHASLLKARPLEEKDYEKIGLGFSKSAEKNGMIVQTCFEERNLVEYGFSLGDCVSRNMVRSFIGKEYPKWKARKGNLCSCAEMVDIGAYNCCLHFCAYCYANYDEKEVEHRYKEHDPSSSLLLGHITKNDQIKVRK